MSITAELPRGAIAPAKPKSKKPKRGKPNKAAKTWVDLWTPEQRAANEAAIKAAVKLPAGFKELQTETLPPLAPLADCLNPKGLGLETIKALAIPIYDKKVGNVSEFAERAWKELCQYDSILHVTAGIIARKKGTLLNMLWHINKDKRRGNDKVPGSLFGRDAWGEFQSKLKDSPSALQNYRHIAVRFPLDDKSADTLGVDEMLKIIADEKLSEEERLKKKNDRAEAKRLKEEAAAIAKQFAEKQLNFLANEAATAGLKAGLFQDDIDRREKAPPSVADEGVINQQAGEMLGAGKINDAPTSNNRTPIRESGNELEPVADDIQTAIHFAAVLLQPLASRITKGEDLEAIESGLKIVEAHIADIRAAMKGVN